jgi:hypothetical protein
VKAPHHSGTHEVASRKVRAVANANPLTLCWRCHRRIDQHVDHHNGKPPRWTAGHTVTASTTAQPWLTPMISVADCEQAAAGDWLAPEISTCNYGARHDHNQPATPMIVTTRDW